MATLATKESIAAPQQSISESIGDESTVISTSNEALRDLQTDSASVEGPHMIYLREAMHKTVKRCTDARYSKFAKAYKFAHQKNPPALKSIVKQFVEELKANVQNELELMIDEENLVALFNDLDELVQTSEKLDEPAWRPTGNPEKDTRSHIMQVKLKEKERLELMLTHQEDENVRLHEALKPRTAHLLSTQNKITQKLNMFQQAAEECDKIPGKDIQQLLKDLAS